MALLSGVTSAVPMQTIRKCCHRWRNLVWNMQSFKQFSYYWLCEPTFLRIILSVIITLWEDITQLNKIWCQIHGSFCHLWQHQLVVCTRTVKLLSPPMVVPSMWPNAETKVNPCHLVCLAKSDIKHHWIIYALLSQLLTWSGNQEVGNERWGMRNEKLEMRNKRLGICKMDLEWDWIGPREMGSGIQMGILVTEVSTSVVGGIVWK